MTPFLYAEESYMKEIIQYFLIIFIWLWKVDYFEN